MWVWREGGALEHRRGMLSVAGRRLFWRKHTLSTHTNTTHVNTHTHIPPLAQVYPDYDFSQLRAHHLRKEPGAARAEEVAEACLLGVGKAWEATPGHGGAPFLEELWRALDEVRLFVSSAVRLLCVCCGCGRASRGQRPVEEKAALLCSAV